MVPSRNAYRSILVTQETKRRKRILTKTSYEVIKDAPYKGLPPQLDRKEAIDCHKRGDKKDSSIEPVDLSVEVRPRDRRESLGRAEGVFDVVVRDAAVVWERTKPEFVVGRGRESELVLLCHPADENENISLILSFIMEDAGERDVEDEREEKGARREREESKFNRVIYKYK